MIHIFLVILKIIGILLAVFLILGLLLLFWPVKYRFYGKLQKEFVIHINFSYMKPVLMVCLDYNKEMNFYIKVMGINVLRREQNDINGNSDDDFMTDNADEDTDKETKSKNINIIEETIKKKNNLDSEMKDSDRDTRLISRKENSTSHEQLKAVNKFFRGFGEKIAQKIRAIKAFFKKLYRSFLSITEFPLKIREFLKDERIYAGYQALKDEVQYFLKKSKPEKYQWYIHYGTGDPCTTGQLLGLLGILYAIWGKGLIVEPDFEQKVFESEFDCKGKMRGIYAIKFILKLYKNRDINYLKEQILKIRRN